jgi:carboxypeptidase Taq
MSEALASLKARLAEAHHLQMAGAVLDWDQQTQMPPGGVAARAEQKATLSRLAHAVLAAPETGALLAACESAGDLDPESDDGALVRMARRDFDRATRLPGELVAEIARVTGLAQEEWAKARAADDYGAFAPWLERILELERRAAEALGYKDRLYDALLDQYEPGMTSAEVDRVFTALKEGIVPLARAIFERVDRVDSSLLYGAYPEDLQQRFARQVLAECGYDFSRGRLERSVHPFCTHFSQGDVRITTRYDTGFVSQALFGCLHEMGHALYEQGTAPPLEGTLLANGASLGLHESQSRLWENLVGRSRPFWTRYLPLLRETFPGPLAGADVEGFYRAINRVAPTLIRVEADEVTYNLHIMLRYELENELLEGRLSVTDAPEAWNARMEEYLGLTPDSNRNGILQDVHWSIGIMGYFPTYTLGNILSVQVYQAAMEDAAVAGDTAEGRYGSLLEWLRERIYRHGRKLLPSELIPRATGSPLSVEPYLGYLKTKFGELYGL